MVAGGKGNKQTSSSRASAGIAVVIVLAVVYLTTRSICRIAPFSPLFGGGPPESTASAEEGKQLGKCFSAATVIRRILETELMCGAPFEAHSKGSRACMANIFALRGNSCLARRCSGSFLAVGNPHRSRTVLERRNKNRWQSFELNCEVGAVDFPNTLMLHLVSVFQKGFVSDC